MASVEFYFDYSCPWSYPAYARLGEAAKRTGSSIVWKPVLLTQLCRSLNLEEPGFPFRRDGAAADYERKDLADWARYCGLQITVPEDWPPDAEPVMRGAVAAAEADLVGPFSDEVFRACYAEGRNIGDQEVLLQIAERAGMERSVFEARQSDPASIDILAANAKQLVERGGFGVPTMLVGDDLYFGNDRMPLVEFALGQASGRRFVMPGEHGT